MTDETRNRALAHAILRFTLGVNISLHGIARFGHLDGFAGGVIKEFSSVLPRSLVAPYAYALPFAEAIVGLLLIFGAAQFIGLAAGALLMASLTFGSALRSDYAALAQQLAYELVYFVLLATVTWDRYSLDGIRFRRSSRR